MKNEDESDGKSVMEIKWEKDEEDDARNYDLKMCQGDWQRRYIR